MKRKRFVEVAASKMSLAKRKRVYGKGINDAWYHTNPTDADGKRTMCPYYRRWHNMLKRCYNTASLKKRPTYVGCTVCTPWLTFSGFRKWMENQNWIGKQIDKDILIIGNKIYLPKACRFVSSLVNNLLTDHRNAGGLYPRGVWIDKRDGKFTAACRVNGKKRHLGRFSTPEQASTAYKKAKYAEIRRVADQQTDIEIRAGLYRHADLLLI